MPTAQKDSQTGGLLKSWSSNWTGQDFFRNRMWIRCLKMVLCLVCMHGQWKWSLNIDSGTTCLYQKYCQRPSDHFSNPKNPCWEIDIDEHPPQSLRRQQSSSANHSTAIGNDTGCNGSDYQLKSFSSMHWRKTFFFMQKITMKGNKQDDWITGIHFSPY